MCTHSEHLSTKYLPIDKKQKTHMQKKVQSLSHYT